jgi:hypothetical protein
MKLSLALLFLIGTGFPLLLTADNCDASTTTIDMFYSSGSFYLSKETPLSHELFRIVRRRSMNTPMAGYLEVSVYDGVMYQSVYDHLDLDGTLMQDDYKQNLVNMTMDTSWGFTSYVFLVKKFEHTVQIMFTFHPDCTTYTGLDSAEQRQTCGSSLLPNCFYCNSSSSCLPKDTPGVTCADNNDNNGNNGDGSNGGSSNTPQDGDARLWVTCGIAVASVMVAGAVTYIGVKYFMKRRRELRLQQPMDRLASDTYMEV